MLEPGFTVSSPRGTVVEILENTPERFALRRVLAPGTGRTPSHRHDNGVERFRLLAGEATGSVDAQDEPTLLQVMAILKEGGGGTWVSGPPVAVQRVMAGVLGRVANARGIRPVVPPGV
jgi:hypothetical protein